MENELEKDTEKRTITPMICLKEIRFIGLNQINYNGFIVKLDPKDYQDIKEYSSIILDIIINRKQGIKDTQNGKS